MKKEEMGGEGKAVSSGGVGMDVVKDEEMEAKGEVAMGAEGGSGLKKMEGVRE